MKTSDLPIIGALLGAGCFGGIFSIGAATYALVVAPKSTESTGTVIADANAMKAASSYVDGRANTASLAQSGDGVAAAVVSMEVSGQTDLYIPSRDELATILGNVDAYPDCALAIGAEQGFDAVPYLTSTTLGTGLLWNQDALYGYQAQDSLDIEMRVRPIWRIALED